MPQFASGRSRLLLLLGIMVGVVFASVGTSLYLLNQSILEAEGTRLSAMAKSQVRVIVTLYQTALLDKKASPEEDLASLLALLTQTYQGWHEGLGATGEIVFARRQGEQIEFLFRQRHADTTLPKPIPWNNDDRAVPMRRALEKDAGVVIGLDYRGVVVMSAFEFIEPLDLGLVIKIDIAELRAPLWHTAEHTLEVALFFLVVGGVFFNRIGEGVIRRLHESEQNLAITLNSIGDGVIVTDYSGSVTHMNPVAEDLTGWPLIEAISRPLSEVFPLINADTRQTVVDPVAKVISTGLVVGMANHTVLLSRNGTERQIADSGAPIRDPKGQIQGVVLVFRDVTEEYQARQEIAASERTYRSLFDNMMNGFAYCRMLFENGEPQDFIFLSVNKAFVTQTGLKNVVGHRVTEIIPGMRESDSSLFHRYGRVAMTGQPEQGEVFVEALGMWFSLSVYCPKAEHFVVIFDVITQRKQAESTLRRDKDIQAVLARLGKDFLASQEVAIENIAQHVLEASLAVTESPYCFVNEVEPFTGWSINRAITGEVFPLFQQMGQPLVFKERRGLWAWVVEHRQPLLTNTPQDHPSFFGTPAGHIPITRFLSVPVISGGRVVAQIGVANGRREYTSEDTEVLDRIADLFSIALERVKLERQLRHTGKLEAIGVLSAGIAHDFNNILGIIQGFAEIAMLKMPDRGPVHGSLEEIITAGTRAQALVNQLLTFSHTGDSPRQPLPLAPLVKEVIRFLRASVPSTIDIETRIVDENVAIVGNASQLYQLLLNLCTNAH